MGKKACKLDVTSPNFTNHNKIFFFPGDQGRKNVMSTNSVLCHFKGVVQFFYEATIKRLFLTADVLLMNGKIRQFLDRSHLGISANKLTAHFSFNVD